jgi:hypothetical protein
VPQHRALAVVDAHGRALARVVHAQHRVNRNPACAARLQQR